MVMLTVIPVTDEPIINSPEENLLYRYCGYRSNDPTLLNILLQ